MMNKPTIGSGIHYKPTIQMSWLRVGYTNISVDYGSNADFYTDNPSQLIEDFKEARDYQEELRSGVDTYTKRKFQPLIYHIIPGYVTLLNGRRNVIEKGDEYLTLYTMDVLKDYEQSDLRHYMSVDEHETQTRKTVSSFRAIISDAVAKGVEQATKDNLSTLEEIQSERAALEKRLERIKELEERAAAREAAKMQRKPRSLAGYVYVVKSLHPAPLYKIGRSNRPDKRTELFGIEVPFDIEVMHTIQTDDMYALESELHAKFADKRVRGEWFNLSADDLTVISELARQQTDGGEEAVE